MNNTDQRKGVINGEPSQFLRGLIIGKVLTLLVIGGLFWWLMKTHLLTRTGAESDSDQSSHTVSPAASTFQTVVDVPIGSFNYGSSAAWAPIRQLVDSQIQSDRPELQLR